MTIEEQMTEFRKKVIQLKKRDKDESILHQSGSLKLIQMIM